MTNVIAYLPRPVSLEIKADDLFTKLVRKEYNADPVGQRISVDNKNFKKSISIIISMLEGSDIGELTVSSKQIGNVKRVDVIDGGHRSRAILWFMLDSFAIPAKQNLILKDSENNNYDISGLRFSELPEFIKDYFRNYCIRICTYVNLSSIQETKIFRNRNQSTPVKHQEMMNAASDNLVAIFIRETARIIPDHKHTYRVHNLFDFDNKKGKPSRLSFENEHLCWEELLSIFCIYTLNGGIVDAGYPEIERLYDEYGDENTGIFVKDKKKLAKMIEEVIACLDFLNSVSTSLNRRFGGTNGSNLARITMAARYYFHLKSKGPFKVNNYDRFSELLVQALYDLVGKKGSDPAPANDKWSNTIIDSSLTNDNNVNYVPSKMSKWMGGYNAEAPKVKQTVLWLDEAMADLAEGFDGDIGITFKDSKRTLGREDRMFLLSMQNFKCYIDGEDLTLPEAAAGHIIAHCNGGKTTRENCRMIRKCHNQESSSMNLDEYKEYWLRKNGANTK